MKLSKPQLRALKYLDKFPDKQWAQDTPVRQSCLHTLMGKGLVECARELTHKNSYFERITPAGREALANCCKP